MKSIDDIQQGNFKRCEISVSLSMLYTSYKKLNGLLESIT